MSHTSRKPRKGEEEGIAYHFTTRADLLAAVAAGAFLEHAEVHGNLYGTSLEAVERCAATGKTALLEIDVQVRRPCIGGVHSGRICGVTCLTCASGKGIGAYT